jgi:hypothetical protein
MSARFVASQCARQTTPELSTQRCRAEDHPVEEPGGRQRTTRLPVRRDRRLDWEMFALWGFVVFSFAALGIALLALWAKCGVWSPF